MTTKTSDSPASTAPASVSGDDGIRVRGLTRRFGATVAVDSIDIAVPRGAFLVLLGPSGCGKTTTLRMLAGLDAPSAGTIDLAGRQVASGDTGVVVPPGKRDAGMVFQSYALWPHMSVRRNIEWPLKVARWDRRHRAARVTEVLAMLDISALADRYPGEISGGQQQRVAIARTIAPEPAVLLFDEPLSNLDAKLRVDTRSELLRIHRVTGATSVYVTHDQVEAMTMATHVALMRHGRIEQFGSPRELLANPASAFVATFVGTPPANVLPGRVERRRLWVDAVEVGETDLPDGTPVQLMYRAESLSVDTDGPLELEAMEASPLAGRWVVTGMLTGTRVSVTVPADPGPVNGARLRIRVPERPDALFDASGARMEGASHR